MTSKRGTRAATRGVLAALLPARAAHRFRTRGAMRDLTGALTAALRKREQDNGPSGVGSCAGRCARR